MTCRKFDDSKMTYVGGWPAWVPALTPDDFDQKGCFYESNGLFLEDDLSCPTCLAGWADAVFNGPNRSSAPESDPVKQLHPKVHDALQEAKESLDNDEEPFWLWHEEVDNKKDLAYVWNKAMASLGYDVVSSRTFELS
jgi:hypothetical protein